MAMKSHLFSTKSFSSDGIKSVAGDIKSLLSLSDQFIDLVLGRLVEIVFPENPDMPREILGSIIKQNPEVDLSALNSSVSVLRFFIMNYVQHSEMESKNTADLWVEDLVELGMLDKNQVKRFGDILLKLFDKVLPEASSKYLHESAATGTFPFFSNIYFSVEMRPILSNEYSEAEDVDKYLPKIVSTVTVASINIETDSVENSEFCFQATERELHRIINSLKAALTEMREFNRYLGR